jgi:hypothetical protein
MNDIKFLLIGGPSNQEWGSLAQELCQQFDIQSQMDNSIIYLDKCCEDATWFIKEFPNALTIIIL